ncbi:hypothetical protein [Wolbachia endosymbiont (group A) of Scambus nigricans]|uniref:hypothetical protein n=1 Tax=Wolbachia endosymbiont (group A) of Scambus nigricans TaxID=2954055 RepID=UPI00223103A5|nr:hypothetical protein [Wolbachia endosymbiont (group A) of Scambus nigricans]
MPAAYSYDLRKKAMEALDEGESRATVAKCPYPEKVERKKGVFSGKIKFWRIRNGKRIYGRIQIGSC